MHDNQQGSRPVCQDLRRQMPIAKKWAYLDHAAVAPLTAPSQKAIQEWSLEATEEGVCRWSSWSRKIEEVRCLAADLIRANQCEIALLPNTTSGIGLVAECFPWESGDNVVTLANEFPSNLYPWMNLHSRGVETRLVSPRDGVVDLNLIAEACDQRTRIISLSWVGYVTGYRLDVQAVSQLAHDQGALLFLDAIQGLGVFPLDVSRCQVDFLAADGHKWMLGPEGAGLFYMRSEHLDLLRPMQVGWNSVVRRYDYDHIHLDLRPEASRYEGGSMNMVGFIALGESLSLLTRLGLSSQVSTIADQVIQITETAVERLERAGAVLLGTRDGKHRSGIVSFQLPGREPAAIRRSCMKKNIALSCRGGGLRISPHAYNNEEDLDRLMLALEEE